MKEDKMKHNFLPQSKHSLQSTKQKAMKNHSFLSLLNCIQVHLKFEWKLSLQFQFKLLNINTNIWIMYTNDWFSNRKSKKIQLPMRSHNIFHEFHLMSLFRIERIGFWQNFECCICRFWSFHIVKSCFLRILL